MTTPLTPERIAELRERLQSSAMSNETARRPWTSRRNPHTDLAYEWFIEDADGVIIGGTSTEAHARLFAAGPELVETLQTILALHGKPHRDEWIGEPAYLHSVAVHDAARSALAKLTEKDNDA